MLPDSTLTGLADKIGVEDQIRAHRARLDRAGHDEAYIADVIANYPVDVLLSRQRVSRPLSRTRALLFKALGRDDEAQPAEFQLHVYVASLAANNVDTLINEASRLRTVGVPAVHHFNILGCEQELVANLLDWLAETPR